MGVEAGIKVPLQRFTSVHHQTFARGITRGVRHQIQHRAGHFLRLGRAMHEDCGKFPLVVVFILEQGGRKPRPGEANKLSRSLSFAR